MPGAALFEYLKGLLHQWLPPGASWAEQVLVGLLDFVLGPIATGSRYHWWGIACALSIAYAVYQLRPRGAVGEERGGFLRFCFPRAVWLHKSSLVDYQFAIVNHFFAAQFNLTWRISGALLGSWVAAGLAGVFGPIEHPWAWSLPMTAAFLLLMSLLNDLGYFLFHWLSHVFPPLWAFHRVHHSAEVMTPLTAGRVHPLERAVLGPIRAVVTAPVIGAAAYLFLGQVSAPELLALDLSNLLFHSLGALLHHSHIWVYFGPVIGRLIVSPAQHQVHHSSLPQHLDRNFAEHWAIWDTIFGTLYLPKGREELRFGLAGVERQPHANVVLGYLVPFRDAAASSLRIAGQALRRRDRPARLTGTGD